MVDEPMPSDVLAEQARIERADAICLVFPLFWWGMPAMMKGWVDRVWSWGWAYNQTDDDEKSMQRDRTGVFLVPAGQSPQGMAVGGYEAAMETLWMKGTCGYFGFSPRKLAFLYGATGSAPRRERLLEQAWEIGNTLPQPGARFEPAATQTT